MLCFRSEVWHKLIFFLTDFLLGVTAAFCYSPLSYMYFFSLSFPLTSPLFSGLINMITWFIWNDLCNINESPFSVCKLILYTSLWHCATQSVKIGLATFRVLIHWHNRINLKRFDKIKLCFFFSFSAIGFQNAFGSVCFQYWLFRNPYSSLLGGKPKEQIEELSESIEKKSVKTQCRILWS